MLLTRYCSSHRRFITYTNMRNISNGLRYDKPCLCECRTKHPGTKHPMPFFATPDKTSRINLPPRTKHPMQFLSPRTKHPMPFLPPWTKRPMLLLPPRTKHPTLCLKPMKVHKTSHLVNCHYYF